jgi:hypothetical protein
MIEKIAGCLKINTLRVIHIYEANYNLILKILWARRLVWNAHDKDRLNEGQAGSRPGRNAINVVIKKEMKYLCSCLTRTGLATMDNDAKSCYDRIICNLAMLVSQYFGMTPNATATQANTLQEMKFRLRTAIGDSKQFFKHSTSTPFHGTGQGSCASPALWLIISSILIDCLAQLGNGLTMKKIIGNLTLQQWIDGFVDDTSLFTNLLDLLGEPNDVRLLTTKLCQDLMFWKELLEASGGKLELPKCFYYVLAWKFDSKGNPYPMSIAEQRNLVDQIHITDSSTNQTIPIQQKEVSKGHKTLGCYKSIIENEDNEIQFL